MQDRHDERRGGRDPRLQQAVQLRGHVGIEGIEGQRDDGVGVDRRQDARVRSHADSPETDARPVDVRACLEEIDRPEDVAFLVDTQIPAGPGAETVAAKIEHQERVPRPVERDRGAQEG